MNPFIKNLLLFETSGHKSRVGGRRAGLSYIHTVLSYICNLCYQQLSGNVLTYPQ
jgi:hypothetical protein